MNTPQTTPLNEKKHAADDKNVLYSDKKIISLFNAAYYFLDWVIIIFDENDYRLLAARKKKKPTDRRYKTLRGAKIAFASSFKIGVYSENYNKPYWSVPYTPEKDWLEEKLKLTEKKNLS